MGRQTAERPAPVPFGCQSLLFAPCIESSMKPGLSSSKSDLIGSFLYSGLRRTEIWQKSIPIEQLLFAAVLLATFRPFRFAPGFVEIDQTLHAFTLDPAGILLKLKWNLRIIRLVEVRCVSLNCIWEIWDKG